MACEPVDHDLVIVTGASSNHFVPLNNLLYTISVFEPATHTIVYDLGMESDQVRELRHFDHDLIPFPFGSYPAHLNIKVNRGQYAWKPVIIADTLKRLGGCVLWLDAGNLIMRKLDTMRLVLARHGFYSPVSPGDIQRWTHPGTLDYLHVSSDLLHKRNRNGAVIGFNSSHSRIAEFVELWKRCALDVNCIAPPGSDRSNHRQDQAVLSVLAYQMQQRYGLVFEDRLLDVSVHNDDFTPENVRKRCADWIARA